MATIKKDKTYYKNYKIKQDKKKWLYNVSRRRKRKKLKSLKIIRNPNKYKKKSLNVPSIIIKEPPHNFSFIINKDETVHFFSEIEELITLSIRMQIFIDMKNVEIITVDAIMYLIAVIKKLQFQEKTNKEFYGNAPKSQASKQVLIESGFYDFVNSDTKTYKSNEKISIALGEKFNQQVAKNACQFVIDKSNHKRDTTYFIYEMICEMMLNTYQHAYEGNKNEKVDRWYSYLEKNDDFFTFIFLDTGIGIPNSVYKRPISDFIKTDNMLLQSALNGEYRTKTRAKNRGNGLKLIRDYVEHKFVNTLVVVSNKGYCEYNSINEGKMQIIGNDMKKSLSGTLYYWKINKEVNINAGKNNY